MTNRLLARLARVVLQAFPGSFPDSAFARTVGNPVRRTIAAIEPPAERMSGRSGPLRVLVIGGSQGAMALNRLVPEALARFPESKRPIVRHQAGERTIDTARDAYRGTGIEVSIEAFIEDMAEAYGWADLVICRAGALTVAELAAAGLPAVFVPFPAAVDDHQTANATPMAEAGAAIIVQEKNLTAAALANILRSWMADRSELALRAEKARSLSRPNALLEITNACLKAAGVTA